MALKRIQDEAKTMRYDPPELCQAGPAGDNMFNWKGSIQGPVGTPYEGGVFFVDIVFPSNYPFNPPHVTMKTPIFHPNISTSGGICMDTVHNNWSPSMTVSKVLLSICSLLCDPNPGHGLNATALKSFRADRIEFNRVAADHTRQHAM